ncbi:MAG: hypothetical protein ABW277_16480 [Longimicrobiaceae bacterium]
MTKDQLSYVRIFVPGTLSIFVYFTLRAKKFSLSQTIEAIDFTVGSQAFIVAVIAGVVYRVFRVRDRLVLGRHWRIIEDNIKDRLISMIPSGEMNPGDAALLRPGKRLINLFYSIVDKDESLKLRRDSVYENGAYVSSVADTIVFASVGCLVHLGFGLAGEGAHHYFWAVFWFAVLLISWLVLLPRVLATHRDLSNEQIDFVADHHRQEVQSQLLRKG